MTAPAAPAEPVWKTVLHVLKTMAIMLLTAPFWGAVILILVALFSQLILAIFPVDPEVEPVLHGVVMLLVLSIFAAPWTHRLVREVRRRRRPPAPAPSLNRGLARNRSGAPLFSTDPLLGYRQWAILPGERVGEGMPIPYLSSPVFPTVWETSDLTARCSLASPRHESTDVPNLSCTCGVYAMKDRPEPSSDRLMAVGMVALSGRVFEGVDGFRGGKAKVVGPVVVDLAPENAAARLIRRVKPGREDEEECEVWLVGDRFIPVIPGKTTKPRCPDARWPAAEFGDHLRSWLEARYGVEVVVKGVR